MTFVKYDVSCFMSAIEIAIVNDARIKMLFVHFIIIKTLFLNALSF